jgi:hypothetical protein
MAKLGINLIEKEGEDGLTYKDILELMEPIKEEEVFPVEFFAKEHESVAMGFITVEAANQIDFDYDEESDLSAFIASILDDMDNETEDGKYEFEGILIQITR